MSVTAVLFNDGPAPEGADEVVRAPTLREGVSAALGTRGDWLWLLDPYTTPDPGALDALLAPLGDLGRIPEPVVLASKVVGPDGQAHPDALPNPEMFEKHVTVLAVPKHL